MIEVLVLDEPLIREVSSAILDECGINWKNILHSALVGNVVLSSGESWSVLNLNGKGEPSLTDFGIFSNSHIQVRVDFSQKPVSKLRCSVIESV